MIFNVFTVLRGTSLGTPHVTVRASGTLGFLFRSNLFFHSAGELGFRAPPKECLPPGKEFASEGNHGAVCECVCLLLQTTPCMPVFTPRNVYHF